METKITRIRTLDDLRQAKDSGLKKGDPIVLADEAGDVLDAVFLSMNDLRGETAIVTLEKHLRGMVRGLYVIRSDGLYHQAYCNPYDPKADSEMFDRAYENKND